DGDGAEHGLPPHARHVDGGLGLRAERLLPRYRDRARGLRELSAPAFREGVTSPLAVVTGGSRGIARAFVLEAVKRGHRVVLSFRSRDADAAETVKMAAALGGEAVSVKADLERFEDVATVIGAAREQG